MRREGARAAQSTQNQNTKRDVLDAVLQTAIESLIRLTPSGASHMRKSPLKPEMPGLSLNSDVNGRKPPTRLSNRSATFKFCPSSPCGLVNPITDQADPTTLSTG